MGVDDSHKDVQEQVRPHTSYVRPLARASRLVCATARLNMLLKVQAQACPGCVPPSRVQADPIVWHRRSVSRLKPCGASSGTRAFFQFGCTSVIWDYGPVHSHDAPPRGVDMGRGRHLHAPQRVSVTPALLTNRDGATIDGFHSQAKAFETPGTPQYMVKQGKLEGIKKLFPPGCKYSLQWYEKQGDGKGPPEVCSRILMVLSPPLRGCSCRGGVGGSACAP